MSDGLVIRKRCNGYYVIDNTPLVEEKRHLELEKLTMKLFLTLGILGYAHDEIIKLIFISVGN